MFGVGFDGTSVPPQVDELIDRGVRCIVLFKRNVESPQQVQDLCAALKQRARGEPLAVTIDHEGGRVLRLQNEFTNIPSARQVGQANSVDLARQLGEIMGRELRAVNIDIDLAPVLDVDTNPNNPVIATRSLGPDPQLVSRLACAIIQGMQSMGVAACGKHFPGHGDTTKDSHFTLPYLKHNLDRLNQIELHPFRAAIAAKIATIMTSHIVFEAIDPIFPATMSKPILNGLLREQLGFGGVIISDDLEMKAISKNYGLEQTMIAGANAGIDLFLICHKHESQVKGIDLLTKAIERGEVSAENIERANGRIDRLFDSFVQPPQATRDQLKIIGNDAHQSVVEQIRAKSERSAEGEDPTERWRAGESPL
jgi:beta-N-acetylhexosaminidase